MCSRGSGVSRRCTPSVDSVDTVRGQVWHACLLSLLVFYAGPFVAHLSLSLYVCWHVYDSQRFSYRTYRNGATTVSPWQPRYNLHLGFILARLHTGFWFGPAVGNVRFTFDNVTIKCAPPSPLSAPATVPMPLSTAMGMGIASTPKELAFYLSTDSVYDIVVAGANAESVQLLRRNGHIKHPASLAKDVLQKHHTIPV